MLGGGIPMSPGEVSLAHRGVLYLDELPEFRKNVLEGLRQPLEAQKIVLARGGYHVELPASFTLIASMNPSPYQYEEDRAQPQAKTDAYRDKQYRQRISQPLLDRIPLQIDMPKLSQEELLEAPIGTSSPLVLARIERSYRFRQERIAQEINTRELWWQKVEKDAQIKLFWVRYMKEKKYSVRTQSMIFDVARTIADLAQSEHIDLEHIYEAIQYRSLDRYFEENSSVNRILNI
jgi:magnesium chelatase family protein